MLQRALEGLRHLGVGSLAGVLVGLVVGGLGGRLVMRVSGFLTAPELIGSTTENGNVVGAITVPGTLALIVFVGMSAGFLGGWLYAALRPWLAWAGRWRGFAYGCVLLVFMGSTFLDGNNFDFRRFGPATLNVAMFALLFVLFGVAIEPLYARIEAASRAPGARATVLRILVWAALTPALAVGAAASIRGLQAVTGIDPLPIEANLPQLMTVGLLGGLIAAHALRAPRPVGYAIVAALLAVGGWRTLREVVFILGFV